jgi:hypothetical protein
MQYSAMKRSSITASIFFARQGFQILFDMPVANDSFSMGCARLRSEPRGQRKE